jgi:putative flippase GtrA
LSYIPAEVTRKLTFVCMGLIAVFANYGANQMAQAIGLTLAVAGPIGYITGGQVNFFLHNFVTWRDRHPTLAGWRRRWVLFMLGNAVGLLINTVALVLYAGWGVPDVLGFLGALCTSAMFNWFWNDRLSFAHHPLDPPEDFSERSDT